MQARELNPRRTHQYNAHIHLCDENYESHHCEFD